MIKETDKKRAKPGCALFQCRPCDKSQVWGQATKKVTCSYFYGMDLSWVLLEVAWNLLGKCGGWSSCVLWSQI